MVSNLQRLEQRLRLRLTASLPTFWIQPRSCQDQLCQEKIECGVPGKQESGQNQWQTAAVGRRIALLSWICVLVFTQFSGPRGCLCLPFAGPQGPIGASLVSFPLRTASPTDSRQNWNLRSTLPELGSVITTLANERLGRHGKRTYSRQSCAGHLTQP